MNDLLLQKLDIRKKLNDLLARLEKGHTLEPADEVPKSDCDMDDSGSDSNSDSSVEGDNDPPNLLNLDRVRSFMVSGHAYGYRSLWSISNPHHTI